MKKDKETKDIILGSATVIDVSNYRTTVGEHEASKYKYTAFQFVYPDATSGNFIITKGTKGKWIPHKELKRIILEWQ